MVLTRSDQGLQHAHDASQSPLDIGIFPLDGLLGPDNGLQFQIRLLAGKFLDSTLQSINLVLCSLPDGPLCLAISPRQQNPTSDYAGVSPFARFLAS